MNRVERALAEADVLTVEPAVAREALVLAEERLAAGRFRSLSAAQASAARTVAARYRTMPGPILVAMGSLPEMGGGR